jgi:Putative Actinobacterial Holin-X, holin superfamily III
VVATTDRDLADEPLAEAETRPTIGDLLSELASDMRAFANAEIIRYRAYGRRAAAAAFIVLVLFFAAVSLLQGAVVAMLTGLIIWFQPMIGTGWAILVVVAGTVVIGLVLGRASLVRARRIVPLGKHDDRKR